MEWFVYAFLAAVFFSVMTLIFKKLTVLGMEPALILLFIFGFGLLFYIFHIYFTKTTVKISYYLIFLIVIAALMSYMANLFSLKALKMAPNPGYAEGFVSIKLAIISIAAVFLFNSELDFVKIVGILFAILSVVLLSL